MSAVLAIDPGTTESAWCRLLYGRSPRTVSPVVHGAKVPNDAVLETELSDRRWVSTVVIEMPQHYGRDIHAGASVYETCRWVGRFEQRWRDLGGEVVLVHRKTVVTSVCGNPRANDSDVRRAILERFPAGKGTKANPGPLYGIKADVWQALAVALWYLDERR